MFQGVFVLAVVTAAAVVPVTGMRPYAFAGERAPGARAGPALGGPRRAAAFGHAARALSEARQASRCPSLVPAASYRDSYGTPRRRY